MRDPEAMNTPAPDALEQDVLSRPREWLVPLLYEHLVDSLRQASRQMAANNVEGKAASLERASAIVFELHATLDFEHGGELAPRLAALYAYFAGEITAVGRSLDREQLARLVAMLSDLHDGWTRAAERARPRASAPGS